MIRLTQPLIPLDEPLIPPTSALTQLAERLTCPDEALTWPRRAVTWFGWALTRPGWALIWFGWALIWGPSAFPDGFYVDLGNSGPNPGSSWSKTASPEPSPPEITALGHEKAGWSGTRLPPPNRPPAHTGGKCFYGFVSSPTSEMSCTLPTSLRARPENTNPEKAAKGNPKTESQNAGNKTADLTEEFVAVNMFPTTNPTTNTTKASAPIPIPTSLLSLARIPSRSPKQKRNIASQATASQIWTIAGSFVSVPPLVQSTQLAIKAKNAGAGINTPAATLNQRQWTVSGFGFKSIQR